MVNEKSIKNAYLVAFIESKGHQDMGKECWFNAVQISILLEEGGEFWAEAAVWPSCCSHFTGLQRDVYECIVFVSD